MKKLLASAAVGALAVLAFAAPAAATNSEKGKDRVERFNRDKICNIADLNYNNTKSLSLNSGALAESTEKGLKLSTPAQVSKLSWKVALPTAVGLNKLSSAGYILTKIDAPGVGVNDAALLSYDLFIDKNGDGSEDFTLVYEPYYNTSGNPARNTTKIWDVKAGKFWANKPAVDSWPGNEPAGGSYAGNKSIAEILALYPNAKIKAYGYHQGTYNDGTVSLLTGFWFDTDDTVKEGYGWTSYCNKQTVEFVDTCVGTTVIMKNSIAYLSTQFMIGETKYQVVDSKTVADVVGTTVVVTYGNFKVDGHYRTLEHPWVKPNNCTSPAPSTSVTPSSSPVPTGAPTLPVTGSKIWVLAGSGTLLVAAGIAALIIFRKKDETKFIAE